MDYRKVYMEIIKKARNRPLTKEKGYEIHHILPKSIFSNWSKRKEKWKDSSYSEKVKKSLKKSQNSRTEKFKKWAAENHKVLSEKRKEYLKANPEAKYSLNKFREENPNFYKELWAKPEMKEKRSKTMTNFYANEENRKKQSERLKNSEKFQLATKLANGIQVRCIQTGQIFLSLADAAKWCKMKHPDKIARVCRHLSKRAGKHPETGEFLTWEFVDIGEINA